jgi:hypothetical protein
MPTFDIDFGSYFKAKGFLGLVFLCARGRGGIPD